MTRDGMRIHPIRPIRTEDDHDAAVARIRQLMGAAAGSAEGEELDVLATLVDVYEAAHERIDAPDPVAAIQFRMEQRGLTRKDLEPLLWSRARVSEVLTGKRKLTLAMIRRIRVELGIPADLLIGPSPGKSRRAGARASDRRVPGARTAVSKSLGA